MDASVDSSTKRRKLSDQPTEFDPIIDLPCDTELAFRSIETQAKTLHGFVFVHQLYQVLSDRTFVDTELQELRCNSMRLKALHCPFDGKVSTSRGAGASSITINTQQGRSNHTALISTESYIASIYRHFRSLTHSTSNNSNTSKTTSSNLTADNGSYERVANDPGMMCDRFANWLRHSYCMSVLRSDLKLPTNAATTTTTLDSAYPNITAPTESEGLTDIDIDLLIEAGFLNYRAQILDSAVGAASTTTTTTNRSSSSSKSSSGSSIYRDDRGTEVYWLSHPALRSLTKCMQTAETELLACIRKTQYKEMSEKKLDGMVRKAATAGSTCNAPAFARKGVKSIRVQDTLLCSSPFPLSYHLLDLQGRNIIFKVSAHAGNDHIIRLR